MTITEHKALVAAIPEDLVEGEEIEVSALGDVWHKRIFWCWSPVHPHEPLIKDKDHFIWKYARRPAAAQKKRLNDDPWPKDRAHKWRAVDANGYAYYFSTKPSVLSWDMEYWRAIRHPTMKAGECYDATDWQNSLERRPE